MRRRVAVLVATLMLVLGATATASPYVTPPADTPNLALMVIQPADLVPGATLVTQGYVKPPQSFAAYYGSIFELAATADGVRYAEIADYVAAATDAATANLFLARQEAAFGARAARKRLVKSLIKETPKRDHLKARDISFSAAANAGVGTGSLIETINFKIKQTIDHQVIVLFDSGTLDVSLVLTGTTNEPVPETDGVNLANTINAHIASVLAASGSTGATGSTGST
jgi:hypothetical protein